MKKSVISVAIGLMTLTVTILAQTSTFKPDLPLNTWVRVDPNPKFIPLSEGQAFRPQSWNKLVYDSIGKRAITMDRVSDKIHDHSIYANAILVYDPTENEIKCLKVNNWKRENKSGGGYNTIAMPDNETDPTPCDRHPYGNFTFVPDQNSAYLSAGANAGALSGDKKSHAVTADTWRFDIEKKTWQKIESELKPPASLEAVMCYDPTNKVIVQVTRNGQETWLLDVETGQWRNPDIKNSPRCGMAASMCFDSKRGRVLLFGGRGRQNPDNAWNARGVEFWELYVREGEWKQLPSSPIPGRSAGMDYDPQRDLVMVHFSIVKGKSARSVFYLCDKNEWRVLDEEVDEAGPVSTWEGLAYDVSRDVFIRTCYGDPNPYVAQWWLFRPNVAELKVHENISGNKE